MLPTHGNFRPGAPAPTHSIEVEHCDGDGGGTETHEIDCEMYGKDYTPCPVYVKTVSEITDEPYDND